MRKTATSRLRRAIHKLGDRKVTGQSKSRSSASEMTSILDMDLIKSMRIRPSTGKEESKSKESKFEKMIREVKVRDSSGLNENLALIGSKRFHRDQSVTELLGGPIR